MTEPLAAGREAVARVETFIKSLPLDGGLKPLRKSVSGKKLSLMARHIASPFAQLGEYAPLDPTTSFLLINIFGNSTKGLENTAFIDWKIQNGVATCINTQMYVTPQNEHEELAAEVFGFPFIVDGFMVEEEYQRNGVGSFMAALSIATLPRLGASGIMPVNPGGYATENAQSTWRKFGMETGTVPEQPFSLAIVAAHPQVVRSIAEFT